MSQRHPILNDMTMLITSVTANRMPYFANPCHATEAVNHLYRIQERLPFFLYSFVIMPNHAHFLVHVPSPGKISDMMRMYKMGLSFQTGIRPLWQQRYHVRIAKNERAARRYVHLNPVKAGLVDAPEKYEWSSASGKWDIADIEMP